MLRSLVAAKPPDDLKNWVLLRLSGEDSMPMLYQGKEVEHPHEAVAALFELGSEVLTLEKRKAVIGCLKEVRRSVSEALIEGNPTSNQVEQARHWAEVVELAKPRELRNDARSFLDACMLAPDSAALPSLAAAATAFAEPNGHDILFWNKLLENRNTAALAFRRLLSVEPFEQAAHYWVILFRNRVKERWPTNMRLLTAALLNKAPSDSNSASVLARLIDKAGLSMEVEEELKPSKDAKVIGLLKTMRTFHRANQVKTAIWRHQNLWSNVIESQILDVKKYISSADFQIGCDMVSQPTLEEYEGADIVMNFNPVWIQNSDWPIHSDEKRESFPTDEHYLIHSSALELRNPLGFDASPVSRNKEYESQNIFFYKSAQQQSRIFHNSQRQTQRAIPSLMISKESFYPI